MILHNISRPWPGLEKSQKTKASSQIFKAIKLREYAVEQAKKES